RAAGGSHGRSPAPAGPRWPPSLAAAAACRGPQGWSVRGCAVWGGDHGVRALQHERGPRGGAGDDGRGCFAGRRRAGGGRGRRSARGASGVGLAFTATSRSPSTPTITFTTTSTFRGRLWLRRPFRFQDVRDRRVDAPAELVVRVHELDADARNRSALLRV